MARSQIATDDFNRASLGADWAQLNGVTALVIIASSTVIRGDAPQDAAARWVGAGSFTTDQYASLAMTFQNTISDTIRGGVIARASGDTDGARDYYYFRVHDDSGSNPGTRKCELLKVVNGTVTSLGNNTSTSWGNGDRAEIECEGTTIRGMKNGSTIISVTDADLSTGVPGVWMRSESGGTTGDDWQGGNLTGGGVTPPVGSAALAGASGRMNLGMPVPAARRVGT